MSESSEKFEANRKTERLTQGRFTHPFHFNFSEAV